MLSLPAIAEQLFYFTKSFLKLHLPIRYLYLGFITNYILPS